MKTPLSLGWVLPRCTWNQGKSSWQLSPRPHKAICLEHGGAPRSRQMDSPKQPVSWGSCPAEWRSLLKEVSWTNRLSVCLFCSPKSLSTLSWTNSHSADEEMVTTWQFLSDYYRMRCNALLFTTSLSFKQAIILEKVGFAWRPCAQTERVFSKLLAADGCPHSQHIQNWAKTEGKELLVLITSSSQRRRNWYPLVLGSTGLSCPGRDHCQSPLCAAHCSVVLCPVQSRGFKSQVPFPQAAS